MRVNPLYQPGYAASTADAGPNIEFINLLIEFMKSSFINKPGIPPVFIYEKNGHVQHITVPISLLGSDNKKDLDDLIGSAVSAFKPDSYCFVSEAWLYRVNNISNAEEAAALLADFKKGKKSDDVVCVEGVMLSVSKVNSDGSTERWIGTVPLSYGTDGNIIGFDSVKWIKEEECIKFKGALVI